MAKEYLIAGNWKMNLNTQEASVHLQKLENAIKIYRDVEVVVAPSFLTLQPLSLQIDRRKIRLAAQNAYLKDSGAFTGEVSFNMLRNLVHYVIIGHSERRLYFNETLPMVRDKVAAAIRNGIAPIVCVGETHQERVMGETKQVLHDQVVSALANVSSEDVEKVVIAYEPVWAISTFGGTLAKPSDIQREITYIRKQVAHLHGQKIADSVRVLYGGSVDDQIARGYLELEGCNGALVGNASLNHHKFAGIINAAHALARESQS